MHLLKERYSECGIAPHMWCLQATHVHKAPMIARVVTAQATN